MVFSSLEFIFRFLPVFFLLYFITPKKFKNYVLLFGSLCFYTIGEPVYVVLMLVSVIMNHVLALFMEQFREKRYIKGVFLALALLYDFGMLFVFKYSGFFVDNVNRVLTALYQSNGAEGYLLPQMELVLPLGISFYTFQIVSYVVDVYRGKIKAEESVFLLATYLCMFPQLISGPIVVYSDVAQQLKKRIISLECFEDGLKLFILGLGSKVLIANRIGSLWNDIQTIGFESISTPLAWMGAFAYTIQIYFDFNGYSLMAVGLGKMLGFSIPGNFNHPYTAKSVTEFWRRWHITLGRWFKEYLYIPLGGNRKGMVRTLGNLLVVWLFTGLWHGAGWNFVLWGLITFLFIAVEKLFLKKWLDKTWLLSRIYMLFVIPQTWVVFAITDMTELQLYFSRLFPFLQNASGRVGNVNPGDYVKYGSIYGLVFAAGVLFSTLLPGKWYGKHKKSVPALLGLLLIFWASVYFLANASNNPFLYFRF